jgi:hypothetical protein
MGVLLLCYHGKFKLISKRCWFLVPFLNTPLNVWRDGHRVLTCLLGSFLLFITSNKYSTDLTCANIMCRNQLKVSRLLATLSYLIMLEAMHEHAQQGICLPIRLLVHPILISPGAD